MKTRINNMGKKAIVIGATGLIGAHLVQQLCQHTQIDSVMAITRRTMHLRHEKLTNQIIDFEKMEQHADLFSGDYLFSCLGSTLKQSGSIEKQRRIDLDYQYTAASLASKSHVPFYLLVSSSGANANSRSAYLKMKGELEQKILHLTFDKIAIFQPSLLMGERKQKRLAEDIGSLFLPLLCKLPGLKKYRPIQGKQVAQKMLQVSQQQQSQLQRFSLDGVFIE